MALPTSRLRREQCETLRLTLDEERGCLCASGDVELLKHVRQVVLDGLIAQIERGSDFFVGQTLGD